MSFRNRCRIVGAEGVIDLSIPLAGGRDQKTLMKDVRIAEGKGWQDRHLKTIVSCYSRSPWFEHYRDELERIYRRSEKFLLDWNMVCFEWSMKTLGMERRVGLTAAYQKLYAPEEGEDWRGKIVPGAAGGKAGTRRLAAAVVVEGAGGKLGAPAIVVEGAGGQSGAMAGEGPGPRYRQVFEERIGFIPDLSILDLLFCEGKEAIKYIRS